jgi:acetate kinase
MVILVINCGSTTLKHRLFRVDGAELSAVASGAAEIRGGYREAVARTLQSLPEVPEAIAHRVVHGGNRLTGLVQVDVGVLNQLRELDSLAPLHNRPALEGIEATLALGVPLLAAFDTAFHRTLPARAWRYAIPAADQIRRYGFHGWSHQSVMEQYAQLSGNPHPTMISLHLGSGCSATAIERGKSVDTSMGFTPLEGLVMGTRPGDLDPGVLTYLMARG